MLARFSHYAAIPLRLVLGALFIALGSQKLFGYFGGAGLAGTAQLMESIGLTPGTAWAWLAGLVELLGGVALVLGVITRWTALVLAAESLASIIALAGGAAINVEFRLAALAGLVALSLIGPQVYALDTRVPALASWSGTKPGEPARKAA
jgi:putative oxidoreductase